MGRRMKHTPRRQWKGIPLGELPDSELAAHLGLPYTVVAAARRSRGIPCFPHTWQWWGTKEPRVSGILRDYVLGCIGYRQPQRAGVIHEALLDTYGQVCKRTVERALLLLRQQEFIKQVLYEDHNLGHETIGYLRVRQEEVARGSRDDEAGHSM